MLIYSHCLLLYLWIFRLLICSRRLNLVTILIDLDLHGTVTILTDRLLIFETIQCEVFFVLHALQVLYLDQIVSATPLDDLVVFPLALLQMLNLARVAHEHRVTCEALILSTILRTDHIWSA